MHKQQIASLAVLLTAALSVTAACSKPESAAQTAAPPPSPAQTGEELGQPADPRFIGKIWASTTPGHARGSLMIFLPDRSLLMDSCFETYRISQWGAEGDRIRWIEDAIPIEATIAMPNENELRLQLAGQDRVQSYVSATVPYVCPDMPR
jgi:glyoxylase-like metal-dependent hydrolase (beta-lactamase superfamily II)